MKFAADPRFGRASVDVLSAIRKVTNHNCEMRRKPSLWQLGRPKLFVRRQMCSKSTPAEKDGSPQMAPTLSDHESNTDAVPKV